MWCRSFQTRYKYCNCNVFDIISIFTFCYHRLWGLFFFMRTEVRLTEIVTSTAVQWWWYLLYDCETRMSVFREPSMEYRVGQESLPAKEKACYNSYSYKLIRNVRTHDTWQRLAEEMREFKKSLERNIESLWKRWSFLGINHLKKFKIKLLQYLFFVFSAFQWWICCYTCHCFPEDGFNTS